MKATNAKQLENKYNKLLAKYDNLNEYSQNTKAEKKKLAKIAKQIDATLEARNEAEAQTETTKEK